MPAAGTATPCTCMDPIPAKDLNGTVRSDAVPEAQDPRDATAHEVYLLVAWDTDSQGQKQKQRDTDFLWCAIY